MGTTDWVACVGIDWGNEKHAYVIQPRDGQRDSGTMESSPEAVHEWVRGMRARFASGTILVAIEQGLGSLVYALMAYEFLALVLINPRASKAYRDSLRLSGASSDPADAELICDFAMKHPEKLRVWNPDDAVTRKMRQDAEHRRTLVDQRTGLTHALAETLKQYFPQSLQWFGGESSALLRAFLRVWSTLENLLTADLEQIAGLMKAHRCRKVPARAKELFAKIQAAVPLTRDAAIIESSSMFALSLVAMLETLDQEIAKYDKAIAASWSEHPDRAIFDSLPGAGAVMAPRLAVAFGLDRSRYQSAVDVQCYSGIAPVIEQSGKHRWAHARWGFPTFLHQTFHEFAQASLPFSSWAKAFYDQQRERGAGHHEAIRSLAFRWIRILFRLWKSGEQYDEQRYLEALRKKHSPLVNRIAA
jgi:transposase